MGGPEKSQRLEVPRRRVRMKRCLVSVVGQKQRGLRSLVPFTSRPFWPLSGLKTACWRLNWVLLLYVYLKASNRHPNQMLLVYSFIGRESIHSINLWSFNAEYKKDSEFSEGTEEALKHQWSPGRFPAGASSPCFRSGQWLLSN